MPDLLVPLYTLPDIEQSADFIIRKPIAYEASEIQKWIGTNFTQGWASEVLPALSRTPSTMLIAVENSSGNIAAFCVWDCTALGFLGPVGVAEKYRHKGLGKLITLSVLQRMKEAGYGYSIIGSVSSVAFFKSICKLSVIEGSTVGIYPEKLKC